MRTTFSTDLSLPTQAIDVLIVGAFETNGQAALTPYALQIDQFVSEALSRSLTSSNFKGKTSQHLMFVSPHPLIKYVILVGLGKKEQLSPLSLQKTGALCAKLVRFLPIKNVLINIDLVGLKQLNNSDIAHMVHGFDLFSYHFDHYKTDRKNLPVDVEHIGAYCSVPQEAEATYKELCAISSGVMTTRNVVNEPPNVVYPESIVKIAKEKLKHLGVHIDVFDQKDLKKLGCNSMLSVSQGSTKEPQLLVLHWNGTDRNEDPIAIVGKGVTFDSGGINIKPSNGMEDMKGDMAGAGVVLGLMESLAMRKAKVNVVGVMGLVENMPSGSASRPSDVVTSMSGKTIEILNTDAEGRLVLADAMWYVQEKFSPKTVIDLATLTGAIVVSLGHEYAGLFSNSDDLCKKLSEAGESVDEKVWRFPLHEEYAKDVISDIADVKNVGSGRGAGSITAAEFLKHFVKEGVEWAHIDIAGVEWDKKDRALCPKGATGFGVRLLNAFLKKNYEQAV